VNAKPETAPKLRLTSSALVLPLVNLATLALILLAITSGGLTIYPAAVGVIVWVLVCVSRRPPDAPS
jgi:hypothetical protein